MSVYPITTSLRVIKELQYVKETTKGLTPSSPIFTAIPVASFVPVSRPRDRKFIKLGNPDITKSINDFTNFDISISYSPINADALLESMVNLTGTNNRDDTYTLLLSQQHNNAGTLVEQYQIARGCTIVSTTIKLAERDLVSIGCRWMALSISDWSTSHGLTGTPTFAPALTATPWATTETGSTPITFVDISSGTSYDVRRFTCVVNHNTERTQILDQFNTVRIDSDVRDIELELAIVFKDTQVSQSVKTFAGQDITVNLNLSGSTLTRLNFSDVFLDKYDETVNAEDRQVKVVTYSGTAASLLLRADVETVSGSSIHKYNMGGRFGPLASIHKYDIIGVAPVSQTSIHKYNILKDILQTSIHKYNVTGVTRFYFHAATTSTTGLPSAEQAATLTADKNMEGSQTTNRRMTKTIGTSQASISGTPFSTSSADHYFTRFVSDALNVSSISANTWTYNFSTSADNTNANFPVDSLGGTAIVVCYVWRPSTSTKVGTILEGTTGVQVSQPPAATQKAHQTTFAGNSVSSMVSGDVIIFEVWFTFDPSISGGSTNCAFYYDGTTVNTTNNATVSNHASFIETPQGLTFA